MLVAILGLAMATVWGSAQTLSVFIEHLPEIMRARSEGRSSNRITKAAVCGPEKTPDDAEAKRAAARAYVFPSSLGTPA